MQYNAGDLLDKCTILEIKSSKGLNVLDEFMKVKFEVYNDYLEKDEAFKTIYMALMRVNREQYELEDKIRVADRLEEVGRIALDIRIHNDERVFLKNEINKLAGDNAEVKLYKRI